MFTVIGLMFTGIFLGFLFRKQNLSFIHKIITILIWLLLFILGVEVGSNKKIIDSLHAIGLEAFIITIGALAGSLLFAWGLWYILYKRKIERRI